MNDRIELEEFEAIEVWSADEEVMVELDYIGEGNGGDYEPDDPDDTPLVRYTLFRKFHEADVERATELVEGDDYTEDEFAAVRDGSYCTQLVATAPREQLEAAARFILDRVAVDLRDYKRQKRQYEELSWIELKDGQPVCEVLHGSE